MKTILIVEDEVAMRDGLADALGFHGYQVETAADGRKAESLVSRKRYDLIVLDLMLPHKDGFTLCSEWRRIGLATPILMLTARGEEDHLVKGLSLGADDYMTKPFSVRELLARIEALLRRAGTDADTPTEAAFAGGTVNFDRLEFSRGRATVSLTELDSSVIRYFLLNPGRVIARSELLDRIWGVPGDEVETRKVDMEIAKLRKMIGKGADEILATVRGGGYLYQVKP